MKRTVLLAAGCGIFAGFAALAMPYLWSPGGPSDGDPASRVNAVFGFAVLLCEVFAFHGGLALIAMALAAIVTRCFKHAVLLAILGAFHAGPGLALAIRSPDPEFAAGGIPNPTLTVLSHNLLYSSAGLDGLEAVIERERPDAIMLQEVIGARADEVLDRFTDEYPHVVWPNTHRWGAMLLSKHAFVETPEPLPGQAEWRIDQPIGVIDFDGAPVALMSVHLPAPNRLGQLVAGPQMAARLADWIEARPGTPMVLAGDFNAPLWTARMTPLREAGIRSAHAEAGGGRGATWPERTPLRFAPGIRLDQAGFVGDLRCVESRVLERTGSDHRPILARFVRAGPVRAD